MSGKAQKQNHTTLAGPAVSGFPLIGPGDPPPFTVYNEHGQAPVLLVCDHASRAFPAAMMQLGVADWVVEKHVASDIGAGLVTRHLARSLDAPAILAGYSRLIVDLNRKLDGPAAFIRVSDGIAIPGNLDISAEEKEERARTFFHPYHEAITAKLADFSARGVTPCFLSIHTCTPVFNRVVRRMHIGVMWDRDPRIPVPLMKHLRSMDGICVGDNEPYSGRYPDDYTIDMHAERAGLPYAGIEVRQDLVSTEEGARKWANILAEALAAVLDRVSVEQVA